MNEKFSLQSLRVGMIQTNCYLLGDNETGKMVVIDPGGEGDRIVKAVKNGKWTLSAIINTHGHFDHTSANGAVKKHSGAKVYIHKEDAEFLLNPDLNGSSFMPEHIVCSKADVLLEDGEEIKIGALTLKVIHTPGHTPGGISLYCKDLDIMFTGDTLFRGDIGRTDLAGGSEEEIAKSLSLYKKYPAQTIIYPGHGPKSTLKEEFENNQYLK
jgi:glyoxylase-like metal-dependent hydrolase (beta-lactamase superfamily II)